jgi:formate hydrogenlyase subunit 3/multisubunit Na+/H+ antiporter MnhD subunit
MNPEWGKLILVLGIILCIVGGLIMADIKIFSWLGRLPGDIRIERENFSFYFPITTMVLISVVVSLCLRLLRYLQ